MPTKCPVLFRDRWLIVVNKPAGLLSHPNVPHGGAAGSDGAVERCAFEGPYDPATRRFETPDGPLWLLHRLDKDASGALLAAFDAETAAKLRDAFEKGRVRRGYTALVGGFAPVKGRWRDALGEARKKKSVRAFSRRGAPPNAELTFATKQIYRRRRLSLVEIELVTGRTHQIRVQMAGREHPVAGDGVYGDFAMNRFLRKAIGLRRLFLHASLLSFAHVRTNRRITVKAPLPQDLSGPLSRAS